MSVATILFGNVTGNPANFRIADICQSLRPKFRTYKHGEAIPSHGTQHDRRTIAEWTSAEVTDKISAILKLAGLPVTFPNNIVATDILRAMQMDKKTVGGKLTFCTRSGNWTISDSSGRPYRSHTGGASLGSE